MILPQYGSIAGRRVVVKSHICAALLALINVLAASGALAVAAPEGPFAEHAATDAVQPLQWLKSGDYAALDRYYTKGTPRRNGVAAKACWNATRSAARALRTRIVVGS